MSSISTSSGDGSSRSSRRPESIRCQARASARCVLLASRQLGTPSRLSSPASLLCRRQPERASGDSLHERGSGRSRKSASSTSSRTSPSPTSAARRSRSPRPRCPGLMALRAEFGEAQAAEGRAHRRLAAHDDPDRGADRDAGRARRRGPLGLVQHLLDPGPRRRRDRRAGRAGLRGEGRDARGLLDLHRPHLRLRRTAPT